MSIPVGQPPSQLHEHRGPDDLLQLLGFRVWGGYGRTDSPLVDFVDRGAPPVGEMHPR